MRLYNKFRQKSTVREVAGPDEKRLWELEKMEQTEKYIFKMVWDGDRGSTD